ncbi:MAG: molybdenum cofactor guanylyltransferase [Acidobacteria bacterium]|nr:molybdenum cofactor guanylyltransferase [Acidobacteriota bacterium]
MSVSSVKHCEIAGYIQAGGHSSRMGQDKSWLEIEGVPMIERVLIAMQPVIEQISIVINSKNQNYKKYEALAGRWGVEIIADLHEHRGPLGGIDTALANCLKHESALILACDLPFITPGFLSFLCKKHLPDNRQEVTVPLDQENRLQPLTAVYHRSCRASIKQMLDDDNLKVDQLYSRVRVQQVNFAEFAHLPQAYRFFNNVNTLEEYERLRNKRN